VCRKAALGVTGLGYIYIYVYIMLCTDYVQVPGNPLSSHEFLCTIKYRFVFKRNILDKYRIMNL